jgi:pantoate--beta-alanine ligase
MEIARSIATFKSLKLERPIGFVPTMGFLHEGHLSLVRKARQENASVVVSIFVNPTQFGPGEDFKQYPRNLERDQDFLSKEGVDVVFIPPAEEMYPDGFDTSVRVGELTKRLEGESRPGHFDGVNTVVAKLFNIMQPDIAYFGQKDGQQAAVIKKMVADLNMNLKVAVLPTVREADGLAMSSRNSYLSPDERRAATVLYKSLCLAEELWQKGELNAETIRRHMRELIGRETLAAIDYVSAANAKTLEELDTLNTSAMVSLAVKIGGTRLIDNIILK